MPKIPHPTKNIPINFDKYLIALNTIYNTQFASSLTMPTPVLMTRTSWPRHCKIVNNLYTVNSISVYTTRHNDVAICVRRICMIYFCGAPSERSLRGFVLYEWPDENVQNRQWNVYSRNNGRHAEVGTVFSFRYIPVLLLYSPM